MTQKRRKPEGYDAMTHDELLADITAEASSWANSHGLTNNYLEALRTIIELHKPDKEGFCAVYCVEMDDDGYAWTLCAYPCTTIQAIEKELK